MVFTKNFEPVVFGGMQTSAITAGLSLRYDRKEPLQPTEQLS